MSYCFGSENVEKYSFSQLEEIDWKTMCNFKVRQCLFYKKTASFLSCSHGYRANWLINILQSLLCGRPSSPHHPTFPRSPHTHLLCQRNVLPSVLCL